MSDTNLSERLTCEVEEAQRNGKLFAVGVILLTPIFAFGALFGLFLLLGNVLPDLLQLSLPLTLAIALFFFISLALMAWKHDRDLNFSTYHAMPGLERDGLNITAQMGVAMIFPSLILESYAMILGSSWLWRGLEKPELDIAANLLRALNSGNIVVAGAILQHDDRKRTRRIIKALEACELVRCQGGAVLLTMEGREFLHAAGA